MRNSAERARSADKRSDLPTSNLSWGETAKAAWSFLGDKQAAYVVGFFVLLIVYFYDLVPAYILGKIIDFFTIYHQGDSLALFYEYAIFLGVSWALVSLFRLYFKNRMDIMTIEARTKARVQSFERLLGFSLAWHAQENSGNKVQRVVTGSLAVRGLLKLFYSDLLKLVIQIGGVIIVSLFLDRILALTLLGYVVVFFVIEYAFTQRVAALTDAYNKANENAAGTLAEGTGNMLAVKALGAESDVQEHVAAREMTAQQFSIEAANLKKRKWYLFQILAGTFMGGFVFLLGRNVLLGITSIGTIAVLFTYFDRVRRQTSDATDLNEFLVEGRSDLGRMMELFKDAPKVRSGNLPFPKSKYCIELKNARFAYPSGQLAMSELQLAVGANGILGVAGHSGSGKSTLAKILLGLYELDKGNFTIGGVDYYKLKREEVTANVSVVLQETELFNFSLRENITLMREVSPVLLAQALAISQLEEVIARLPDGLETLIGERGYMLSGGERQRLGIARAICKNPKIVILDEATSSLDSKTEKKITDALLKTYRGEKTFIIIAHRLSTLRTADRIVVFENGTIVEEGKFSTLTKKEGSRFAEMYKLQTERQTVAKEVVATV